jgi:CxxC-x17-CxxC domain-containing protein
MGGLWSRDCDYLRIAQNKLRTAKPNGASLSSWDSLFSKIYSRQKSMDIILSCVICHEDFEFNESEQNFFASRGFSQPKRCQKCRPRTNSFENTSDTFGRLAYRVNCSNCGVSTTVPFKPNDGPVYCKPCFKGRKAS